MTETRPLRAYADIALGRQRSPQHDTGPHMVPYLRAANVKDGYLDLSDVKEMNFSPAEQRIFDLQPGDVLVTEGSGSLSAVGASAVWSGELAGTVCFQNTLLRLRPHGATDPRFLAWWCRFAFADGLFASAATGANIFHLSADRVRGLPMTWVGLEEQRAIADFLDAETARIDALIDKKRRLITLLTERLRSLIDALFDELRDVSRVRLGWVADLQTGLTVDAGREQRDSDVKAPYLRVANVQAGGLDLSEVKEIVVAMETAKRTRLEPGDVLMTEGGDLDKLGRGTVWKGQIPGCLHQNHVFAVRPDASRLVPEFLSLYSRSSAARRYFESTGTRTTNLASTNSSKVLALRVPLPSPSVQGDLLGRFLVSEDRLEGALTRLEQQITLLEEKRRALITAAVTGEFTVPGTSAA